MNITRCNGGNYLNLRDNYALLFHRKPLAAQSVAAFMMDTNTIEKTRYTDEELNDFKMIIQRKLAIATEELTTLITSLQYINPNGTDDTSAAYNTLDDGAATLEKETIHQMAVRQRKFIEQLSAALVRIGNKTYGICRVTGKLIPKERLLAVPHTTMSMEAKSQQR